MKFTTSIVFTFVCFFTANTNAEYPRDFVSGEALGVLSIRDGESINTLAKIASKQAGFDANEDVLANYLSLFIENSSDIDFSNEVLLAIEPTVVAEGQKSGGLFGPMPHLVFICKPKANRQLQLNKSYLTTSVLEDGWFIATGGMVVNDPKTYRKSPILDNLKSKQISMSIEFGALWKKFGPIAQMTGGMLVGGLNKPGADGLISAETKKTANASRKAFGELMKFCSTLDAISLDVGIKDFKLVSNLKISTLEPTDVSVDNQAMNQMASLLADDMVQYGMSGELTRTLLENDFSALQSAIGYESPHILITQGMKLLSDLSNDNVVSYSLSDKNGLAIAALTQVESQKEYLAAIPNLMSEFTGLLLNEANLSATPSSKSDNTWDIAMIGSDAEDQKAMDAVFPPGDTLRFKKYGKDKISIALGPKKWKSLTRKHASPLAKLIKQHKKVSVQFAMTINARECMFGFLNIAKKFKSSNVTVGIKSSPSAKISMIYGKDNSGYVGQFSIDIMGIAQLSKDVSEVTQANKETTASQKESDGKLKSSGKK
ncbi:MAG: hypothetical protein H8E86_05135 [Planctomycetes bacterium]|nr:hypothetical protein [Planctomycetota bacterium]